MNIKKLTAHTAVALSLVSFASLSHADFLSDLFSSKVKEPVVLNQNTKTILTESPVWVIDGEQTAAWSLVQGKKPKKGNAPYYLKQDKGTEGILAAQLDAGSVARNTERISLARPATVSFEKNGNVLLQYGPSKQPVTVALQLKAYDVSGLKMSAFLKNRQGAPIREAEKVGTAAFPQGSVAYKVDTTFLNDELVLPINENFTSAKTSGELLSNFSQIPFCLKRVAGTANGIQFDKASASAKSGTFQIIPVKRETMFCTPTGESAVAKGTWTLVKTGNAHAVVLTMPKQVSPREYGIEEHESVASKLAFVAPTKGDKVFRPGKFFAKGTTIQGQRYFFNTTAAEAILKAAR